MKTIERSQTRFGTRLYALVAAVVLLAVACGADTGDEEAAPAVAALADESTDGENVSDDGEKDSDGEAELTPEEAELAFSQCLEENGVDDPFGGDDGETIEGDNGNAQSTAIELGTEEEAEAFQAAINECGKIFDDAFGEFELSPEQEAERADLEAAFNQCMTDKGFKVTGQAFEFDGDPEEFEVAAGECDKIFEEGGLSIDQADTEGEG